MKLHADLPQSANVIHAATRHSVSINGQVHTRSVIVPSDAPLLPWNAASVEDLTEAHFDLIVPFRPELVIFGSGPTLRFAHPRLMRALMAQRIGVETMDTQAACRTYSILVAEGRKVVAALLIHD